MHSHRRRQLRNHVFQQTNAVNGNADPIAAGQCEIVSRDYPSARHQVGPIRETVVTKEIFGKLLLLALQLRKRSASGEDNLAGACNFQPDSRRLADRRR